jgi:hypothetical protein
MREGDQREQQNEGQAVHRTIAGGANGQDRTVVGATKSV